MSMEPKTTLVQIRMSEEQKEDLRELAKEYRLDVGLKEGISQEVAKKLTKLIRDEGPKTVKAQIQGDELRVSSKSKDDLQSVMNLLRGHDDIEVALQFTNYR